MTTTTEVTVKQAELITGLFLAGHGLDYVCERGATGATPWTRAVVLELVRRQGWQLDGSGRVPRSQRPAPPRPGPMPRPPRRLVDAPLPAKLEKIAAYDEAPRRKPTVTAVPPKTAPDAPGRRPITAPAAPAPIVTRKPATIATDLSEAVDRFLAERTTPAGDEEFIPSPDLRAAYDTWRAENSAPEVTPRWFGVVLTAKYRKKQSAKVIDGTKPVCYFGITWKPAQQVASPADETPTEKKGTASGPSGPGHGIAGPDAQPQVSPSPLDPSHPAEAPGPQLDDHTLAAESTGEDGGPGASDAPVGPPATAVPDHECGIHPPTASPDPNDWVWNAADKRYEFRVEAASPALNQANAVRPGASPQSAATTTETGTNSIKVGTSSPDLLARGLEHPHPAVRAKAKLARAAIDDLVTALLRRPT